MSLSDTVGSSLRWSFALRFGSQILIWSITILVMRQLSPSDYGLMAMAVTVIGLLTLFRTMGLHTALVQARDLEEILQRKAFGLLLLFNGAMFAACNILAPLSAIFFAEPDLAKMIHVLSISIPFGAMETVAEASLRRKMDFKRLSIAAAASNMAVSLVTLLLAYSGVGVWALVFGNMCGAVLRALLKYILARGPYLPLFSFKGLGGLLQFGAKVMASQCIWFLNTRAGTIIIGKFLGSNALGIFEVGKFISNIPLSKTGEIMSSVAFSSYSRTQDNKNEFAYYFVRSLEVSAFFLFPALLGISSISHDLIVVMLGTKWISALPLVAILPFVGCFRLLETLLGPALDASGRPEKNFYNMCRTFVIATPALIVGAQWGLIGIATSLLISYPLVIAINYQRSLKVIGCSGKQVLRAISRPAIASLAMYAAVVSFQWVLPEDIMPVLRLGSSVIVGALTYGLFALTLNRDTATTALKLLRPGRA